MDKLIYDIWLSLALTPGSETFLNLRERFNSSEAIFSATEREIVSLTTRSPKERERLLSHDLTRALEVYEFCKSRGVGILTFDDERFPDSLRQIPTPPVLLYYRGTLPDFSKSCCIAVVGTRSISKYGRKHAFSIAHDLALAGAVVVSGMALGIDGVGTAGALAAGGVTVAVLGSGIDVCYPPQHKTLAREIVKHGCVFTEYAPGTKPERFHFPKRNRIISGLCAATIVIEGREDSGSVIIARHAKEQGRTVYALPANVGSKNAEASNLLLRNGARVCTCADDVVRDFEVEYRGILNPFKLAEGTLADMRKTLLRFEVSAVSAEDDIFDASSSASERKKPESAGKTKKKETSAESKPSVPKAKKEKTEEKKERTPVGFDERTLKIYNKIPADSSVHIESLVDEENTLRDVMKAVLKLEMSRFVKMLPGERVARNL